MEPDRHPPYLRLVRQEKTIAAGRAQHGSTPSLVSLVGGGPGDPELADAAGYSPSRASGRRLVRCLDLRRPPSSRDKRTLYLRWKTGWATFDLSGRCPSANDFGRPAGASRRPAKMRRPFCSGARRRRAACSGKSGDPLRGRSGSERGNSGCRARYDSPNAPWHQLRVYRSQRTRRERIQADSAWPFPERLNHRCADGFTPGKHHRRHIYVTRGGQIARLQPSSMMPRHQQ